MNKEMIYQLLHDQGINFTMITEALGVSKQAVHMVISKGKGSKRIAQAISEACECPLEDLFPFYAEERKAKVIRKQKQADLNERLKKLV